MTDVIAWLQEILMQRDRARLVKVCVCLRQCS